jgi:hypothetical protein
MCSLLAYGVDAASAPCLFKEQMHTVYRFAQQYLLSQKRHRVPRRPHLPPNPPLHTQAPSPFPGSASSVQPTSRGVAGACATRTCRNQVFKLVEVMGEKPTCRLGYQLVLYNILKMIV